MLGNLGESRAADRREAEWQFAVPDLAAVESWIQERTKRDDRPGGISVGAGQTLLLTDRYQDTDDWRLWRAGYALRVRSRGKSSEATLKSLAEAGGCGIRRRREISEAHVSEQAPRDPEGPVGSRLRALIGDRKLAELFEVRTRRVAYPLYTEEDSSGSPEATSAGELAVDETEIPVPGAESVRLHRVEVEAGAGAQKRLKPFVSELREGCGLATASGSKFDAGLEARELTLPGEPDFGPEQVDSSLTLGEVAYAVMRQRFRSFLGHEPGARLGEEPEEVHDMRDASRRLRAVLQTFEPALPEKALRFEPELKHFAAVLGEVRDLDLQLEGIEARIPDSPEESRGPLEELRGALREERDKAREKMLAELDSRRYERLVDTFARTLRLGPPRRNKLSGTPVTEAAPDLVRHAYRRVRKAGDRLDPGSAAEDYHGLRKRCKRLRYLVEALEEVYGGPARKLGNRIKPLQDALGELQDAEAARERLRRIATEADEPGRDAPSLSHAATFAAGAVSARHDSEAEELRESVPAAYPGIKGKPRKRLEKAMKKEAQKTRKEREEREEQPEPHGG
jgi:CHAD domain-containing protein